jgi:RNA polymerase sigma-70 factor (ECF subfamily)
MAIEPINEACVAQIRAGDRVAFEQLFRGWYGKLADYAVRIVGSPDAAEDIVQTVFVSVWNRRDALPDATTLPAYLRRAVRNRALNHLRDTRSSEQLSRLTDEESSIPPRGAVDLEASELAERLAEAMGELAPRTREVFELSRVHELTYREIADTLGISIKTVETLMGRALRALRAALRSELSD